MSAYVTPAGESTRLASEEQQNPQTVQRYAREVGGVTHRKLWMLFWIGMTLQAMGLLALAACVLLMLAGGRA